MGRLSDQTAIVTGAAKGIGAAIAEALAADGANVTITYAHDHDGAAALVTRITEAGGSALAVQGDVASPEDTAQVFAASRERFGPATVLVSNAGVFTFGPLESVTVREFHRHFDTNVLGAFLAAQAFVRQPEADRGSIVIISSVGVAVSSPNASLYAATKSALVGMTRNLSVELAPRGIRVNAIAVGLVDTEGTRAAGTVGGSYDEQIAKSIPLGRIGRPGDIGPVAVFLASDDARWISGDTVFAAGGAG